MALTPCPTLSREHWHQQIPRLELIPTHDLYWALFRLFPKCDRYDLGFYVRRLLSTAFDIWAIDNRLKDPYMPHYPPPYEPSVKMGDRPTPSYADRVVDSAVWGDIDLVNLFADNQVKQRDLAAILGELVNRLEAFYPPTGYDSLTDIQLSTVHWCANDLVIHVRA